MSVLLVTYDLHQSYKDCQEIMKFIQAAAAWAKLSESSYAIKTQETPKSMMNYLQPLLHKTNRLFVVTLTYPYAGYGSESVNMWLKNNLSE